MDFSLKRLNVESGEEGLLPVQGQSTRTSARIQQAALLRSEATPDGLMSMINEHHVRVIRSGDRVIQNLPEQLTRNGAS